MYAIIATGGKQYKVSEGDVIQVEKLDAEPGSAVTFDQVIAISDNGLKVAGDVANSSAVHIQFIVNFIFAVFASANLPIKVKFPA